MIETLSLEEVFAAAKRTPSIADELEGMAPVSQEWSASGALHFQAVHRATQTRVLLKVGVSQNEMFWTEEISRCAPHLVPTLFLSGRHLDHLDLSWKVVEVAEGGVLGPQWGGREFEMLLESGVEFQRIALGIRPPSDQAQLDTRTRDVVGRWLHDALPHQPPGPAQALVDRLDEHFGWIEANCEFVTCHGDLHMCNAVTRTGPPIGSVLLIDFAPCRQPWAFDAARLQVLNSTDPARVGFRDLVRKMAAIRHTKGLSICPDLDRLSRITLAWFAMVMWHHIPDRRSNLAYREILRQYIEEGAQE
ncbi:MAG: aminoglycoside phosphotransferase family protein [Chloroflexi bacterium]|nr:aminoglycoside phosphotransferase family protein [Chloroflexota bacterium]